MGAMRVFERSRVVNAWLISTAALALAVVVAPAASAQSGFPWMNPSLSPTQRADLVVEQMSLTEKIDLMTGDDPAAAGTSAYFNAGIPRLGVPELRTADAGAGIARAGEVTAFPRASHWPPRGTPTLVPAYAQAVADEARATRHNVVLGPNADIVRNPWWGRVGETESEDPVLTRGSLTLMFERVRRAT